MQKWINVFWKKDDKRFEDDYLNLDQISRMEFENDRTGNKCIVLRNEVSNKGFNYYLYFNTDEDRFAASDVIQKFLESEDGLLVIEQEA